MLYHEPGAARVREAIAQGALVGTVNLSEVVAKLSDEGMTPEDIRSALDGLRLVTVPFDSDLAYTAGLLRPVTKRLGLSLGARACLALAQRADMPALTTDRTWQNLHLGIGVALVR